MGMGDSGSSKKKSVIPEGLLPSYLANAFGEVYEEDGLVVLGKGLGWLSLLASFVRFYADVENGHISVLREGGSEVTSKPPLVVVLGLRDSENQTLLSLLETWGTPHKIFPTIITNEAGQGKDRAAMYQRGGVFCITSRILIVDLLSSVIRPKDIDGFLIAHADQVTNESTEAFIVRIYTSQRRRDRCFIKAFSDSPEGLLSGFARVDKTLKALQVRNLYLYPRFHDNVKSELEQWAPDVEELHQPLSPIMKEIQSAIVAAVQSCIRELKGSTPFVEWTTASELTAENCATSSFNRAVSKQLEKDWHRLKPQTKQLVHDLKTLRTLFQALCQYDCVSFWKLINSIKTLSAASRNPSMWLLTPAADVIFKKAKERVYKIISSKPTAALPNPVSRLTPVLEENPKWRLLKNVLLEIQQTEATRERSRSVTIMLIVKNERSADGLKSYLLGGREKTMAFKWLHFLEQYNDRSRSIADCKISEENRLLLEEEGRVRRVLFGKHGTRSDNELKPNGSSNLTRKRSKRLNEVPDYVKKRRRIAVEQGRGQATGGYEDRARQAVLDEAVESTEKELKNAGSVAEVETLDTALDATECLDQNMFHVVVSREPRIIVKSLESIEGDGAGLLLQDLEPDYVVMHDNDVAFIRAVEVYATLNSFRKGRLKVDFLAFEASAEQKVFMKSLEKEQSAFERLIHHKKTMPPPVLQIMGTQEMQQAMCSGQVTGAYQEGCLPLAVDTRSGNAMARSKLKKRNIAVDVREFRSALPSILHQGGMRLAPVTLTVGDFVLSNVHCVERKSISDLFGSFASGRLYSQAETMCKHYKCPALLIEFDASKTFCLQNVNELGMDIKNDSICSKMALLTIHFPKLRILWSRSPHETLRLFKDLKTNHEEVNVEKAVEIGRSESLDVLLRQESNEKGEDEINKAGRDMLLRLPGVNIHNGHRIMRECGSLAELSMMSRDQLRQMAGPVAGQKLYTFFGQDVGAM